MRIIKTFPAKQPKRTGKAPTKKQRDEWNRIASLGCIVLDCGRAATIHHCGTGGGGRKNHDYVIPLCPEHHTGRNGIDGQVLSKRGWQTIYGSEKELWLKAQRLLQKKYQLT